MPSQGLVSGVAFNIQIKWLEKWRYGIGEGKVPWSTDSPHWQKIEIARRLSLRYGFAGRHVLISPCLCQAWLLMGYG